LPEAPLLHPPFIALFSFLSHRSFILRIIKTRHKIPLIACAEIVAIAAPAHPSLSTIIQNKSRKMFRTADNARNINGVLLSPTDRKILDR